MNIYVLNKELDIIGVVDNYVSIIWTTRYYLTGNCELYLGASDSIIALLQKDFYLVRDKDIIKDGVNTIYKNVMVIKNIELSTDTENGNFLIITGKDLKSILGKRIIWKQTTMSGRVESCIRRAIQENVINPTDTSRKIQGCKLGTELGLTDTIEIQVTHDNLEEFVEKLCETYQYGIDVSIVNNEFMFTLYVGEDRSYNQSVNTYVVFSPKFDNLISTTYKDVGENYKNVAIVGGEGEGTERKTAIAGVATGIDRCEMFVDANGVSSNNGEFTDEEYTTMLIAKGNEQLASSNYAESFEGSAESTMGFRLNKDYFLGDIVQVINEYGISATPRILEIIESEDDNGIRIIPTFSTWEV